jgi:uncharacterized Fe-S radical SAM superfamily protein PflX
MTQYFPANMAGHHFEINRKITPEEYRHALSLLEDLRIGAGWVQDLQSAARPVV